MSDEEKTALVIACAKSIDDGLAPLVAAELIGPEMAEWIGRQLNLHTQERGPVAAIFPRTGEAVRIMRESEKRFALGGPR